MVGRRPDLMLPCTYLPLPPQKKGSRIGTSASVSCVHACLQLFSCVGDEGEEEEVRLVGGSHVRGERHGTAARCGRVGWVEMLAVRGEGGD